MDLYIQDLMQVQRKMVFSNLVPLLKAIVIRMHLLHLGLQCESR